MDASAIPFPPLLVAALLTIPVVAITCLFVAAITFAFRLFFRQR